MMAQMELVPWLEINNWLNVQQVKESQGVKKAPLARATKPTWSLWIS